MPFEVRSEADLAHVEARVNSVSPKPQVFSVADVLSLKVEPRCDLIEGWLPARGANLIIGKQKSNKTLLSLQAAIAVASGHPFLDYYKVLKSGPVLIVEQDDPAGAASVQEVFNTSPIAVKDLPIYVVQRLDSFTFGPLFTEWLESEIVAKKLVFVVLDSYTALRGSRKSGIDIVKAEQGDLTMLDELGKKTNCCILIIHHVSKGSAALEWSDQSGGTYAMGLAVENLIHVSRFPELEIKAPERLVRIRGRHLDGTEMVLRFRKDTLDHTHALEGAASSLYPLLLQLQKDFRDKTFSPKELSDATGVGLATAHRQINRLQSGGVLVKRSFGVYALVR